MHSFFVVCFDATTSNNDLICTLYRTIPFGQQIDVPLPSLNFKLDNEALPLQLEISGNQPILTIEWEFKLAFGFDESDGFFIYTFPGEASEFFIKVDIDILDNADVDANLLYFLE